MNMVIVLDTGPVGMITNPNASATNRECYQWMESLVLQGAQVWVPEIADYEVRRELLRANKVRGLARLDLLKNSIGYLPLTTPIMLKAADRSLTRRILNFVYGRVARNGWIGRQRPALFRAAQLTDITVSADTWIRTDYAVFMQFLRF
jgi:hypothetical protein